MRPLLALVVLVLLAGVSAPFWTAAVSAPAPGVPRLAVGNHVSLDPTQASTLDEFRLLAALTEALTRLDPATLQVQPALAERWECAADGRTWRFHLGHRRWSDGSPVTAEQVVAGFARHRAGSASAALLTGITEIAANGAIVTFSTRGPMPWLPQLLATPVFIPLHPLMAETLAWARPTAIVGNGPLRCVGESARHHLDLAPSPTYSGPHPAAGALRLRLVDDPNAAVRLYLDGRVDAILRLNSDTLSDLVRAQRPDLQRCPSWGTEIYRFNAAIPLAIRRSVAAGIDRQAIVRDLLGGNGVPATTLIPASATALGYALPQAELGPATALPPGTVLDLLVPAGQPERVRIAEWLCDRWRREQRIDIHLTALPGNQVLSRTKVKDYRLARGSLVGDYLDPAYFLDCFRSSSGMNRTGWSDPEFERLLDEAAASAPERRMILLAEAERLLLESAIVIPLYHYACAFLVAPGVSGIRANTLELVHYADVRKAMDVH